METMTLNDICKILKISTATGRNRISQNLDMPPSFKVGRKRLFFTRDVEKWLKDKQQPEL